jgi:hypothetical protein
VAGHPTFFQGLAFAGHSSGPSKKKYHKYGIRRQAESPYLCAVKLYEFLINLSINKKASLSSDGKLVSRDTLLKQFF